MKELKRIKVLEDELALLKADLMEKEKKPVVIKETLNFLVHPTELGEMNWEEAKKACALLGEGWRLPNRVELLLMYQNKHLIGGYTNNCYWSSTEYGTNLAGTQNFYNGDTYYFNKSSYGAVRAVKTI